MGETLCPFGSGVVNLARHVAPSSRRSGSSLHTPEFKAAERQEPGRLKAEAYFYRSGFCLHAAQSQGAIADR